MTSAHISRRCKTIEFSQVYAHAHFNLYCSSIVCCLGAAEANYHQLTRTLQKLVLCFIDADFLRSCTHWNTFDEIFVQKYADVVSATNSNVAECLHSLRQNVSQILPDGRLAFRSKMLANFGKKCEGALPADWESCGRSGCEGVGGGACSRKASGQPRVPSGLPLEFSVRAGRAWIRPELGSKK